VKLYEKPGLASAPSGTRALLPAISWPCHSACRAWRHSTDSRSRQPETCTPFEETICQPETYGCNDQSRAVERRDQPQSLRLVYCNLDTSRTMKRTYAVQTPGHGLRRPGRRDDQSDCGRMPSSEWPLCHAGEHRRIAVASRRATSRERQRSYEIRAEQVSTHTRCRSRDACHKAETITPAPAASFDKAV
jgi:hypothetical protein